MKKLEMTDEEKRLFETASLDTIYESLDLSQKSHEKISKSRAFVTKLKPFLDALERYGKAFDVYTNAAPIILCPLWGSIRVLLIVCLSLSYSLESDKGAEKYSYALNRLRTSSTSTTRSWSTCWQESGMSFPPSQRMKGYLQITLDYWTRYPLFT